MRRVFFVPFVVLAMACSSTSNDTRKQEVQGTPNATVPPPADPPTEEEPGEGPGDPGNGDGGNGGAPTCPPKAKGWRAMASLEAGHAEFLAYDANGVWTGKEALFLGTEFGVGCAGCTARIAAAYDPIANKWRVLPRPPLPNRSARTFFFENRWIVMLHSPAEIAGAELDLATGVWTPIPLPAGPRRGGVALEWVPSTKEIVSWGGVARATETGPEEMAPNGDAYSVVTRTWRAIPDSPLGGRLNARAAWDGRRVVFAWGYVVDEEEEGVSADPGVAAWDPSSNTWEMLPDPGVKPRLREVDATIGASGTLGAFFGGAAAVGDGDFWPRAADGVAWDGLVGGWHRIPEAPVAGKPYRRGYASWVANGRLFVFGGDAMQETEPYHSFLDDGASYDPSTRTWTMLPSGGPSPRAFAVGVWTGCEAIVFGGRASRGLLDGKIFRP